MKSFLILTILHFFSTRSVSCSLECELCVPAVSLSPIKITELLSYIESQSFILDEKILDDVAITELEVVKKLDLYKSACDNEDNKLNITQLLKKYGCSTEVHHVITEDGYILTLFRALGKGHPVFLMHGLFSSADDYVTPGPDSALVYYLVEKGYDVWLGNARGNKHSRNHTSLSPECADFWNFSWHEIGVYDLPCMIDYVLKTTGQDKLSYVGHSQGTTSFFVMASEVPEYNKKITVMIAMAPCAFMSHVRSPLVRLLALSGASIGNTVFEAIGQHEFAPGNAFIGTLASVMCGRNALAEMVCSNFIFLITGFDHGQINVTKFEVMGAHSPAGASTKQLIHYAQSMESGEFRQFDYGVDINKDYYGCPEPPSYALEKINAPVALFYSNNDWFSNITDVNKLRDKLQNVEGYFLKDYCHFDYLCASNMIELVNDKIFELLKKYSPL